MTHFNLVTRDDSSRGIRYCNERLGTVAHINRKAAGYEVFPYQFPPCSYMREFHTLQAAECYVSALAYEMFHLELSNSKRP